MPAALPRDLLGQDKRFEAALLLAALGATDWVDGYIARHFHQVSTLGKVLDPVADRLLFFVGIAGILLVDPPGAPVWFCWMVIAREVFVWPPPSAWPRWAPSGSTSPGSARPARSD